jgi:hypothetical protein
MGVMAVGGGWGIIFLLGLKHARDSVTYVHGQKYTRG